MKYVRLPLASVATLLWLTGAGAAFAQVTDSASSAAAESSSEQPIVLSPFEVRSEQDTGYRAASTLAGGRIETALDRTPAAVSIMTRDFLDDIGATNFTQAAVWTTNVFRVAPTSDFSDYRIDFRSTGQAGNGTVNYFIFSETMDSYSTERLEFARGPNAIMFGEGNLAGMWTVSLKRAQFRNFGQLQARIDTRHSHRASLDLNRVLWKGKAAVRVALLSQNAEYFRQPSRDDRQGLFASGIFKFSDTASFRFEAEYGERQRLWGDQPIVDRVSAWTGTPYTGNGTTPVPAGQGMEAITPAANYLVFQPNHPELGVINLRGFARTVGNSTLALVPGGRSYVPNSDQMPSREFDVQPPNNLTASKYYFTTAYLEKRFGKNLFVQLAMNHRFRDVSREGAVWVNDMRKDPNQFLPNGQSNPNFGKLYVDGNPWVQRQWQDPRDFRLMANYTFETSWTKQNIGLLASYYRNQFHMTNTRLIRSDNTALPRLIDNANIINQRYYLDEELSPWAYSPEAFANSGVSVIKYRATQSTTANATTAIQLTEVGSYFGDTLSTIIGVRRDYLDRYSLNHAINSTAAQLTLSRTDMPQTVVTTPSFGVVYYPIPQLGAFVNYSESFTPPGIVEPLIGTTQSPEPTVGESLEYGVHFNLLDQRISGSLRYYDSLQTGRIVNAPGVTFINNIWTAMGRPLDTLIGTPRDNQNLTSTGYEFELVANLTPSWRTAFNFALPKSKQNSSFPYTYAYREQHLSTWQAAAANNTAIRDALINLQTALDGGNDGREQNSALKYTANIYSSYDIRGGALKGVGFGGGANFFGDQIIGNAVGQPFNYIHTDGYVSFSAHLNYKGRWRGKSYRIQLNVENVFDKDQLIYGNVGAYQGVNYPSTYRFLEPRRIALTTTFDF